MPIFQFEAIDGSGQIVRGTEISPSLDTAVAQLNSRGLEVRQIGVAAAPGDPVSAAPPPPETAPRSVVQSHVVGRAVGTVSLHSLHFFFRQFGTMLKAGINPADALDTLSKQSSSKLSAVLRETRDHVVAGRPVSVGFQRYPEIFTPLMMSMVRVGEETGTLDEQCRQLSEYIQRDIELRNMIKRETAMPKITVAASIFIILGANSVIAMMAPGGQGIAAPVAIWVGAAVFGLAVFFFVRFVLPIPPVRRGFDSFTLALPWFGKMILGFSMAKFGRAFGALYRSGVSLPRAIELAADSCGNEAVRARVYPAARDLESGRGITETFAATQAFSPIVLDMTRTGETTGNMEEMLTKVAEYYEDEGQVQAQLAAKIFGVLVLLLVAVYVLYIVIGFYVGYFASRFSA